MNTVSLARKQEGPATLIYQRAVITAQRSLLQERQNQQRLQPTHFGINSIRVGEQAGNRQVSTEDGSLNVQQGDPSAVRVGDGASSSGDIGSTVTVRVTCNRGTAIARKSIP